MSAPPVTVLCSGVHLGVYVPGVLVEAGLRARGVAAEVETLEAFYRPDHLAALEDFRAACHRSFRFALMARKMGRDPSPSVDDALVDALLERWADEGRRRFVMWSGFWLPLVARYRDRVGEGVVVDHCRIDAAVSPSFGAYPHLDGAGRDVWFWNGAAGRLDRRVPVAAGAPVPWGGREDRYVVHGGGWGVGTYQDRVGEMRAAGLALDRVAYTEDEAHGAGPERAFMVDPAWRPWARGDGGRHLFPPFAQVAPDRAAQFPRRTDRHPLFDLVAGARGVVSKPGGGTLIDSLESATPLVLLEPYGAAEAANAALWERLGLGIGYARWRDAGYDPALLHACHQRLLHARARTPDYCESLARELLDD